MVMLIIQMLLIFMNRCASKFQASQAKVLLYQITFILFYIQAYFFLTIRKIRDEVNKK